VGRRRRLLDHGGVLLGDLIHLVHRGIDLMQARRLFLGRGCDLCDHAVDLSHLLGDAGQGAAGLAD
jgi:hypothetical protein